LTSFSFLEILSIFRTTRGQTCDYSSVYEEVTNFSNDCRFDLGDGKGWGIVAGVELIGAKKCGRLLCSNLKLSQSSFSTVLQL